MITEYEKGQNCCNYLTLSLGWAEKKKKKYFFICCAEPGVYHKNNGFYISYASSKMTEWPFLSTEAKKLKNKIFLFLNSKS